MAVGALLAYLENSLQSFSTVWLQLKSEREREERRGEERRERERERGGVTDRTEKLMYHIATYT